MKNQFIWFWSILGLQNHRKLKGNQILMWYDVSWCLWTWNWFFFVILEINHLFASFASLCPDNLTLILIGMHFLEFYWSQKYHQLNGHPLISGKWHLTCSCTLLCLVPKLSIFQYFEFDLSRASGVKSDFPPHLKINFMVSPNYGRSFMLFSKSAQFLVFFP